MPREQSEIGLDALQNIEVGHGIDVSEYEGRKARISSVTPEWQESVYGEDGKLLPEGSKRKKLVLRVQTEPVGTFTDKEGVEHKISGSSLFNLKYDHEKNTWGPSDSEKSNLSKFLKKLRLPVGMEGVKQLVGKEVILKMNDAGFLNFVY